MCTLELMHLMNCWPVKMIITSTHYVGLWTLKIGGRTSRDLLRRIESLVSLQVCIVVGDIFLGPSTDAERHGRTRWDRTGFERVRARLPDIVFSIDTGTYSVPQPCCFNGALIRQAMSKI